VRTVRIIEHISLDGVIQAPGGPDEDGDYPYGGWSVPFHDDAAGEAIGAGQGDVFGLLLGRKTYDIFSGFWPKAESGPMTTSINSATKYVATQRPESLAWGPAEALGSDIVAGISPDQSAGKAFVFGWNAAARIRARRFEGRALRRHHQHVHTEWAASNGLVLT